MNEFDIETKISESKCCKCGHKLDGASGPCKPDPGDVTLCIYCGSANVFTDDLTLRHPTDEEMLEVATNSDFQLLRRIILEVKNNHGKSTKMDENVES